MLDLNLNFRFAGFGGDVRSFIESDVVYGVKEPLIVEFVKKPPGKASNGEMVDTPFYEVKYDFVLEEQKQAALAAAE